MVLNCERYLVILDEAVNFKGGGATCLAEELISMIDMVNSHVDLDVHYQSCPPIFPFFFG